MIKKQINNNNNKNLVLNRVSDCFIIMLTTLAIYQVPFFSILAGNRDGKIWATEREIWFFSGFEMGEWS